MKTFVRAVIRHNNKFLVIKEYKAVDYNVWNFPGGRIDEGEDLETCIIRELKEEVNLDANSVEIFHQGEYDYGDNGLWKGYFCFCNVDNVADVKIMEPKTCDGYCWLPIEDIVDLKRLGINLDAITKLTTLI